MVKCWGGIHEPNCRIGGRTGVHDHDRVQHRIESQAPFLLTRPHSAKRVVAYL